MTKQIKLGIIAAPGWMDPTMGEFMIRHSRELEVTQTILGPLDFDYSFEQIAAAEPHLIEAACLLAQAGCDVIAQVGPAFSYLIGGSSAGARALAERLRDACGVPVVLNGVAVLDMLESLDARQVAAACPYYNEVWKTMYTDFLTQSGYEVETIQSFVDQGMFPSQDVVDQRQWQFSEEEVKASVRHTVADLKVARAVLISGSGIRTLNWISQLRDELGVALISADYALYIKVLQIAKLQTNLVQR
jgi:maleate cis-trans isomerase